jgi:hypothetical protein
MSINGFLKAFERQPDGSWICGQAAEWHSPGGRIQVTGGSRFAPGKIFMGVELARVLDEASAAT